MKRILIATVAGLSLLAFPINAMADRNNEAFKRFDRQSNHQHVQKRHSDKVIHRSDARNERRSGTQAREDHQRYKRHKTDHKAVKRRVDKHHFARDKRKQHLRNDYQRDRRWVINHSNNSRFLTRRAFYNHYYGYGDVYFYDQHRSHYEKHHSRHRKPRAHRQHGHHEHDSDYLEWVTIMYLLNDIYGDDYYD